MNNEEQKKQALQRQKLLESMYSKEEIKKLHEFNPKLAQSFLLSAQLREAIIEPLKPSAKRLPDKTTGYIYILKSQFISGSVKIGYSDRDPLIISNELSRFIGMPGQFEIVFSCRILNADVVNKKLHSELSIYSRDDEFFDLDADLAQLKVKNLLASWGLIA